MYEYYLDKTLTLGGSLLQSESDFKKEGRIALHSRLGFAKGKSFMFELGLFDNASKRYRALKIMKISLIQDS